MATDGEFHHHAYSNNWSQPNSIPSDSQHPQGVSISELIDHGSISFGRFAMESLAWEKWSVFSHNKCQEELEKFKAPGLVAQKKAYFEEYYRKARAMKKLQADQEETNQYHLCQEEKNPKTRAENSGDITNENEDNYCCGADQITFLKAGALTYQDSFQEVKGDETLFIEQQSNKQNDNLCMKDVSRISFSTIEQEHIAYKAVAKPAPLVESCSETTQQGNLVSNAMKPRQDKLKDHAANVKVRGNATITRNKKKFDDIAKKDVVKPAEKPKSFLRKNISAKGDHSSQRATSKAASSIRSDKVSSRRLSSDVRSTSATMHCSFSKKHTLANSSSQGFANKSTLKEITDTAAVRNMNLETRRTRVGAVEKPSGLSSNKILKPRQAENQTPKSMSTNFAARDKSSQCLGKKLGSKNDVKGVKHKQIVPRRSTDLTHAQKNMGSKMPSWR